MGPQVTLSRFVNKFKTYKISSYTDARGWEDGKVAVLAGFWGCSMRKWPSALCWSISYPEFLTRLKSLASAKLLLPERPTIAYAEFLAAVTQVGCFTEMHDRGEVSLEGVEIILKIDSTNSIGWIRKGKMRFSPYNNLCVYLLAVEIKYNCKFTPVFVKSRNNRIADSLTREYAGMSKMVTQHGVTYTIGKPSDLVLRALVQFLSAPTASLENNEFFSYFEVRIILFLFRLATHSKSIPAD